PPSTTHPPAFPTRRSSDLRIDPAPNDYTNGTDSFGNTRSYFSIFSPHERLRVEASSRLRVRDRNPDLDPAASPDWRMVRDSLQLDRKSTRLNSSHQIISYA